MHLTDVTPSPQLPWARPTFPVFGFLIEHPDGPILVDSGVGSGHALIDRLYSPHHHSLDIALGKRGVAVGDVRLVISSHLHFDHCGQNHRFVGAPVVVQRTELEAARAPRYTVPEWAEPPNAHMQPIDGEQEVADGVRVVPTPGHTAGHQSVVIESEGGCVVVAAQAAWDVEAFALGELGDEHGWDQAAGRASLTALRRLGPREVHLSHCVESWRP